MKRHKNSDILNNQLIDLGIDESSMEFKEQNMLTVLAWLKKLFVPSWNTVLKYYGATKL